MYLCEAAPQAEPKRSALAEVPRRADAQAAAGSSGDSAGRAQLPESASSNGRALSASPMPQRSPSAERSSSGDLSACAASADSSCPWSPPCPGDTALSDALLVPALEARHTRPATERPPICRVHPQAHAAQRPRGRRRRPAQAAAPGRGVRPRGSQHRAGRGVPGRAHWGASAGAPALAGELHARQLAAGRMDARREAGPAGPGGGDGALRRCRLGGATAATLFSVQCTWGMFGLDCAQ